MTLFEQLRTSCKKHIDTSSFSFLSSFLFLLPRARQSPRRALFFSKLNYTTNLFRKEKLIMVNTKRLRCFIGLLGMLLPWVVFALSFAFGHGMPDSISATWYLE